jgi:uncharacterized Zn-finger protein
VKLYHHETGKKGSYFLCTYETCNKVFRKWLNIYDHLLTHSKEQPYKCLIKNCDKAFRQKCNLKQHVIRYCAAKHLECNLCKVSFKTRK